MPHQLRQSFATEMLDGGAGLEMVGRILSHASTRIMADIYHHVRTEEIPSLFFVANCTIQAKVQIV